MGVSLLVLLLFVATVALGAPHSLESFKFPGRFILHKNSLGFLQQVVSSREKLDATWKVAQRMGPPNSLRAISSNPSTSPASTSVIKTFASRVPRATAPPCSARMHSSLSKKDTPTAANRHFFYVQFLKFLFCSIRRRGSSSGRTSLTTR